VRLIVGAACVATGILAVAPAATADPPPKPREWLSVTPSKLAVPADEVRGPHYFAVTNGGRVAVDVEVRGRDFVTREDGNVAFRDEAPYSASHWIVAVPDRLRLAPGATARVAVRLRVPADAEPGDHQVVLVFTQRDRRPGPGIKINRAVGAPIVFAVPGSADASVRVLGLRAPRFAVAGPLRFTATVRSTGTVHRDFAGGHRLAAEVAGGRVTFPDFMVLRGATRTVTATWSDPPLVCFCRARVALRLPDGTVSLATAKVTVIPVHLIVTALGGLAVVVLLLRVRRARRRGDAASSRP
jgi:hypothetical protein